MTTPRQSPYLWPTWLTKILAGERSCEWEAWFKAHYEGYAKAPQHGDLAAWKVRHTEMVRKRAEELRAEGYEVFIEDQNKFTLRGHSATLQGKPDIVGVKDDDFLVVDCKGGKKLDSDQMQVLIYMMVLPLTHAACLGKAVRGELEYQDDRILIDTLPGKVRDLIAATIVRVSGAEPLPKVPSYSECRFCDLTKADCKERVESKNERVVKSDLF